jgi:hypothetical protein
MEQHACTLIGCPEVLAEARVLVVASSADLEDAKIEACRNTRCSEAVHRAVASNYGNLVGDLLANYSINGETDASVMVTFRDDGSPLLADGDVYTVRVTSSTGTLLATHRWTATYATFYPNGEDCDDGGCRKATLTPES